MAAHVVELEGAELLFGQEADVLHQDAVLPTLLLESVAKQGYLLLNSPFKPCASRPKFITKRVELLLRNLLVLDIPDGHQLGLQHGLEVQ